MTNRFDTIFPGYRPGNPARIAVIAAEAPKSTGRAVEKAMKDGAQGVFLSNHATGPHLTVLGLDVVFRAIMAEKSGCWVGLQYAQFQGDALLSMIPRDAGGLWVAIDTAFLKKDGGKSQAERFRSERERRNFPAVCFGEIVSQTETPEALASLAAAAIPHVDIVLIDGGNPDEDKALATVRAVRERINGHRLAGNRLSEERAARFADVADCLLITVPQPKGARRAAASEAAPE